LEGLSVVNVQPRFAKKIKVKFNNDINMKVVPVTNIEQNIDPLKFLLLLEVHEKYNNILNTKF